KDELFNFKTPDIDYIIFLDSDDYWELNCIEECVPRMDGVEVVWFKEKVLIETHVDISTKTIFEQYYSNKTIISKYEWIDKQLNKDDFFQFVCFGMIDFNFLKAIHLKFENNIVGEDRIFGIILFLKINFIYMINQELYFYRIRDNSICNYNNVKIQKYPKYFNDLFRKCKNIERHIGTYSCLKMLMILIQYCESNKKILKKSELFLIKKKFLPSFYNRVYKDMLKCDKIPIFMKISFFKIDFFWLEFCEYSKNKLFIKINNNILFLLIFLYTIILRLKMPIFKENHV
ncbi:glycosyltransferase family 2 protein, partial [Campylobacter sp. 2457A]|uniref:glycosyltransferase family 2 protein n=1 Tax=Campylobacter sp. 2457A TaxID=2735784 RepID=UPI00301BAED3|nr:glycosyltransferase family 2 protein [Campylobacter sp. 2457A]